MPRHFCHVTVVLALVLAACSAIEPGPQGGDTAESRPVGQVLDDTKIKLALSNALSNEDQTVFQDVGTVVYRGRVLLVGTVADDAARQRAAEIASARSGVREVLNEVQVTSDDSFTGFVNDSIITKRIQLRFFWDEHVDSSNVKVRSVNGVVYLLGQTGTREEFERAVAIAGDTEDVRRIVNFLSVSS